MLLETFKKHALIILLVGLILILLFLNFPFSKQENDNLHRVSDDFSFEVEEAFEGETQGGEERIIVDVKGAVKRPGVYEIASQSRVNDVIVKAGGFTEEADEKFINLAEMVHDEMLIYVPSQDEESIAVDLARGASEKLRINHASEEDLQSLPGIGPSKASAIVQYREENGPFQTAEDLLNVPGIGEKTLANFAELIQVP